MYNQIKGREVHQECFLVETLVPEVLSQIIDRQDKPSFAVRRFLFQSSWYGLSLSLSCSEAQLLDSVAVEGARDGTIIPLSILGLSARIPF